MKKYFLLMLLFFSSQFAYADLDGNFDYMNIQTEHFNNLKIQKTTLADFRAKYPSFKPTNLQDGQVIFVKHPQDSKYSEIRVGFNKNIVEWVEFILKDKADLESFLSRYGDSDDINRNYHEIYNYYNYENFNISADKQGRYLYSITLFDNPKLPEEMLGFDQKLPDWDNLNYMQNFIPKEYLEEAFNDDFESLYPQFNNDGSKTYVLKDNIISKYSKVEFVFKDGLLKFLVLYPKNITFDKITQIYGKNFKFDKTTKDKLNYDYGDFHVITDLHSKVIKIIID
jgi:hypothetical protein